MNKKNKQCIKCKSSNIIEEEDILAYCNECGYIQNQKLAKLEHDELEEWEDVFKEVIK